MYITMCNSDAQAFQVVRANKQERNEQIGY